MKTFLFSDMVHFCGIICLFIVSMDHSKDLALSASCRLKIGSRLEAALWSVLLIAPLVTVLVWGAYFDDSAYVSFRYARDLAVGRGLASQATPGGQPLPRSPLYVLALALLAALGVPVVQAALVLSGLGWGVAAVAVYSAGRAMRRPVAAMVSALLFVCSPVFVSTLGTEIPWAVAWAWTAIASSIRKRWYAQAAALALMLGTHFDWRTLAAAALLLVVQWTMERRLVLWPSLILVVAALGWGLLAARQIVTPFSPLHLGLVEWTRGIQQFLEESEFYWLFLPLMGLGLFAVTRKAWWVGLLGVATLVLSDGAAAGATLTTLGLFLAGLGIDWVLGWVETHDVFRLDRFTLAVGLVLLAGLPLGVAHVSSLVERYQFRPVVRQKLEQQAGEWLRVHSEPMTTVLGSQRVGYLADRSNFPWRGDNGDPVELASLVKALNEDPPEYCVSFRSLAWDRLTQADLFQDGYVPLQVFESPYDATSPFTIWGYRLRAFDLGEHRPVPLNVHLPGGVDLVGYHYWPDRIQPGDAVSVTVFLQATQPVTESFYTVVRLTSPNSDVGWAQDTIVPRSVVADRQQTGQVVADRLVLTTTAGIPVGAYRLEVSAMSPDLERVLRIYRRDDTASLDRLILGSVVVPWQGEPDAARPVGANLGSEVSLLGFEAPDRLSPGAEFDVVLYWEALRSPQEDYVVFVHLLGGDGQLVASYDRPPLDGRYPTTTWLPGDVVPDALRITLDPNIPVGTYRLQVGMYHWPSLERLPVWDNQGVEQPDRVVVLQSIEVQ